MVCRLTHPMIPYFNAGIYLDNKAKIGKVEEVFGPINKVYFTIKPDNGVNAKSFKADDKVYIGTEKLLPISRFTNEGGKKAGGGGRGKYFINYYAFYILTSYHRWWTWRYFNFNKIYN